MEQRQEEIPSDISQASYLPEQLDPTSPGLPEPVAPPPRRIRTRTQTALQEGRPRRRFSHYGYSSESELDDEREPEVVMPTPQHSARAELEEYFLSDNPLEPLFPAEESIPPVGTQSQEIALSDANRSEITSSVSIPPDSLAGMSAPLMTNPSLTDILSNFPLFPSETVITGNSSQETTAPQPTAKQETPTEPETKRRRGRPKGSKPSPSLRTRTSVTKSSVKTGNRRTLRRQTKRWSERGLTLPALPSVPEQNHPHRH